MNSGDITNTNEFNSLLRNRKAKMLNFPGSSSKQMLHYIDIHLEDKSIDTVLLHVGVNDLLKELRNYNPKLFLCPGQK